MRDAPKHGVSAREDFLRTASQDATVERQSSPADRKNVPADKAESDAVCLGPQRRQARRRREQELACAALGGGAAR